MNFRVRARTRIRAGKEYMEEQGREGGRKEDINELVIVNGEMRINSIDYYYYYYL